MLHEFQQSLAAAISGDEDLPKAQFAGSATRHALGIRVYRNNAAHARVEALAAAYPAVKRIVGDDCFETLALDMARHSPTNDALPAAWTMCLPEFIGSTPLGDALPYLADVARIEAAMATSAEAADPATPDLGILANAEAFGACRLRLALSTYVILSEWRAYAIWNAQRDEPDPESEAQCHAIIFRQGLAVSVEPVGTEAAAELSVLSSASRAGDLFERADAELASLLGRLIGHGAIIVEECS